MLDKISKIQIILLGLILGISLITCVLMLSSSISRNEISTTGMAYEIVQSDSAKWTLNFTAMEQTRALAYKKLVNSLPTIKEFLQKNGIKENEIELGTINSYPNYKINPTTGNMTQEVKSYTYSQDINIRSKNVELIKKLQNESQILVEKDINIQNSYVEYYYSQIAQKKAELLSLATLDAKNRADGMLKATNNKVGKMKSARMGIFQITRPESNEVSNWGINDTSTIDKKITAVANVVFFIK